MTELLIVYFALLISNFSIVTLYVCFLYISGWACCGGWVVKNFKA